MEKDILCKWKRKQKAMVAVLISNKIALNMCLSIITLNVSGLNAPTKRHKVAEWIRKQDPYI